MQSVLLQLLFEYTVTFEGKVQHWYLKMYVYFNLLVFKTFTEIYCVNKDQYAQSMSCNQPILFENYLLL